MPDLTDLVILAGVLALVYGVWLIYPPVAFVLGGLLLACFGIIVGETRGKRR